MDGRLSGTKRRGAPLASTRTKARGINQGPGINIGKKVNNREINGNENNGNENNENGIIANFESWNAKAIYFYDNNNNIVEFIARHDLNNATEKPFDTSIIESISEIGIVTEKPIELAENLIESSGLYYFDKSTKNEQFAALGNDNGLFIIVETNRKWYPTEHKAERHFCRVNIEIDGNIKEFLMNEKNQ